MHFVVWNSQRRGFAQWSEQKQCSAAFLFDLPALTLLLFRLSAWLEKRPSHVVVMLTDVFCGSETTQNIHFNQQLNINVGCKPSETNDGLQTNPLQHLAPYWLHSCRQSHHRHLCQTKTISRHLSVSHSNTFKGGFNLGSYQYQKEGRMLWDEVCFAAVHLFWLSENECPNRFQATIRNHKIGREAH